MEWFDSMLRMVEIKYMLCNVTAMGVENNNGCGDYEKANTIRRDGSLMLDSIGDALYKRMSPNR